MSMPRRITLIGDRERRDHHYLTESDRCFFWGEYTPTKHIDGQPWGTPTNQLIFNLKKSVERKSKADWRYKVEAIQQIAKTYSAMWEWGKMQVQRRPALVPIPPSKSRAHPLYDDRMIQVLNLLAQKTNLPLDIRDCLSHSGNLPASHGTDDRPSPDVLYSDLIIELEAARLSDRPGGVLLFDDLLTTGAHFSAAKRKLQDLFPDIEVVGIFVARRVPPSILDEFEILE